MVRMGTVCCNSAALRTVVVDHHGTWVVLSQEDIESIHLFEIHSATPCFGFVDKVILQNLTTNLILTMLTHGKRKLEVITLPLVNNKSRTQSQGSSHHESEPDSSTIQSVVLNDLLHSDFRNGRVHPSSNDLDDSNGTVHLLVEGERVDGRVVVAAHGWLSCHLVAKGFHQTATLVAVAWLSGVTGGLTSR